MNLLPLNLIAMAPLPIKIGYFALSLIIAVAGRNRIMGFWGYLFCSIIFSPIIGLMVLIVSEKTEKTEKTTDVSKT